MEFFRSVLHRTKEPSIYIYIFVCKFEPMTCALFDQVQRDLRVVFEGPVWDATHCLLQLQGANCEPNCQRGCYMIVGANFAFLGNEESFGTLR
jgi:hypothetical protein